MIEGEQSGAAERFDMAAFRQRKPRNMAEYRLSPGAQRDLDELFDYTMKHWGLPQAMRYADDIQAACTHLAEAPQQAQSCPQSGPVTDGAA
ncbi:type II toxin-antitoxin system RelE/ParE family toxin [Sphingomonas qilianensis]|uniref:Type II toxin-antitoxin system RelE/ParE family toxin n=1 Tax=Sphingomonas qilianensis TaxID=1736690 RepID=A0ABU9XVR4_9SPHN